MRNTAHRSDGFHHQPLRGHDPLLEALRIIPCLLFQGEQSDIDTQQGLGDFILKFETDLFAFILVG